MINKTLVILALAFIFSSGNSFADQVIEFGPQETAMTGSIKYSVVGKYTASFKKFKGNIIFDTQNQKIKSVYLEIEADTIE